MHHYCCENVEEDGRLVSSLKSSCMHIVQLSLCSSKTSLFHLLLVFFISFEDLIKDFLPVPKLIFISVNVAPNKYVHSFKVIIQILVLQVDWSKP